MMYSNHLKLAVGRYHYLVTLGKAHSIHMQRVQICMRISRHISIIRLSACSQSSVFPIRETLRFLIKPFDPRVVP